MNESYFPVLILLGIASAMAAGIVGVSSLLGTKRPTKEKLETYECGAEPIGNTRARFSIRFVIIAILFIVFDFEGVTFYPWAIVMRELGIVGLVDMFIFVAVLLIGFLYAWRTGALDWD